MIEFEKILALSKVIAVVGLSEKPYRTSHRIAQYMQNAGYRIIPVNPTQTEVLGEISYPSLQAIPSNVQIDIVNIFRRPKFTLEVVEDLIQRLELTETKPVIWTQLGVSSQEAKALAQEHQLPYIENRCIMVEHARYF